MIFDATFRAFGLVVVPVVPVVFMFLMLLMFFMFFVALIRLLVTISTSVPIRWVFVRMTIRRRVSMRLLFEAGLKCEHTE